MPGYSFQLPICGGEKGEQRLGWVGAALRSWSLEGNRAVLWRSSSSLASRSRGRVQGGSRLLHTCPLNPECPESQGWGGQRLPP